MAPPTNGMQTAPYECPHGFGRECRNPRCRTMYGSDGHTPASPYSVRYRLVRITHDRCDEYDGREYLFAPAEWTVDQIRAAIHEVADEMINEAKLVQGAPEKPSYAPPYGEHPNKTVAAVQAIWEKQKAEHKKWLDENRRLSRSLEARLIERGFLPVWDDEHDADTGVVDVTQWWGHNHGLDLNYDRSRSLV